jgi:hypothetical protein
MFMSRSVVRRAPEIAILLCFFPLAPAAGLSRARHADLSSWNDGPAKKAIVEFVATTTDKASPNCVPPAERIATFDNDGTLWAEQPMVELLAYLRAHGYKTFIVSGGGIEFMRPWAEQVYGVPPEQVVGSSVKTKFEIRDGKAALVRLPELNFIDDREGKPVGIYRHIGRRPIAAVGNSDGDRQMLEHTTVGFGGARPASAAAG